MTRTRRPSRRHPHGRPWSRLIPLTFAGGLVTVFAGFAVVGPNGVLAWGDYRAQHDVAERELAEATAERDALANRVKNLDPSGANADLAEELVRRDLGVIRPDEVILPLK